MKPARSYPASSRVAMSVALAIGSSAVSAFGLHASVFVEGPETNGERVTGLTNAGIAIGNAYHPQQSGLRGVRWGPYERTWLNAVRESAGWYKKALGINSQGVIVGGPDLAAVVNDQTFSVGLPLIWQPDKPTDPARMNTSMPAGIPGSMTEGVVMGINDAGIAFGCIELRDQWFTLQGGVVLRWTDPAAPPQILDRLPTPPNTSVSFNYALPVGQNASGTIIGYQVITQTGGIYSTFPRVATRWFADQTAAQRLDDLSPSTSPRYSHARDVNDANVVVGESRLYVGTISKGNRPVVWDAETSAVTALPLWDLPTSFSTQASASLINNAGVIFGFSQKYDENNQNLGTFAVRWDSAGAAPTELGQLPRIGGGIASTFPVALNENGNAVGYQTESVGGQTVQRAVLWLAGRTQAMDLNALIGDQSGHWFLTQADQISETGWIAGVARYDADGATGPISPRPAYYSILVPEAGTYGRGDGNFDTLVDFDDLLLLAQHYGQDNPDRDVNVADFNLDGLVDFDDLLTLAQHYRPGTDLADLDGLGAAFAADWALAQSLVPEPVLAGICIGFCGLRRRRRHGTIGR